MSDDPESIEHYRPKAVYKKRLVLRQGISRFELSTDAFKHLVSSGRIDPNDVMIEVFDASVTVTTLAKGVVSISSEEALETGQGARPAAPSGLLLSILLDPSHSTDALANLEDRFHEDWVSRYGIRKARMIFRVQVLRIIVGTLGNFVLQQVDRIAALRKLIGG